MVRERGLGDRGNFFPQQVPSCFFYVSLFPTSHTSRTMMCTHTPFFKCARSDSGCFKALSHSLSLSHLCFDIFPRPSIRLVQDFTNSDGSLSVSEGREERGKGVGGAQDPPPPDIPTPPNPDLMRSSWPSPRRSRSLSSSWICRWWVRAKKYYRFFFWQIFDFWVFRPRIELLTSSFIS